MRHVWRWARDAWLIGGISGLALVAIELGARVVVRAPSRTDIRAKADGYGHAEWPEALFRELAACDRVEYEPYGGWHRRPYHGRLIDVDDLGHRRTWNPAGASAKVLFFGGSTMWGTGARDEHTIPSEVSRLLARRAPVHAVNEGETGYVSTQELIRLLHRLRAEDPPEVIVFLDGVNDVFAAYQGKAAGLPHNDVNRRREFNLTKRAPALWLETLHATLARSAFCGLFRRAETAPRLDPIETARLAGEVARVYASNVADARALAASHGVSALFYLQPVGFTKEHLTEYEREDVEARDYLRELFLASYAAIRERLAGTPGFHDLSGLFREERRPRFIDFCHLTEAANAAIAERMAADLDPTLRPAQIGRAAPRATTR